MKLRILISILSFAYSISAFAGAGYIDISCKDKNGRSQANIFSPVGGATTGSVILSSVPGTQKLFKKVTTHNIYWAEDFSVITAFATRGNDFIQIIGTDSVRVQPRDGEEFRVSFTGTILTPGEFEIGVQTNLSCELTGL